MKHFATLFLFLTSAFSFAAPQVASIAISPRGAVLQTGSNLQYSVVCTYVNGSQDDCSAAGGATWSTPTPSKLSLTSSGLATWNTDPGSGHVQEGAYGFVVVSAGGLTDRSQIIAQHPGDVFYEYPTPDFHNYTDNDGNLLPLNVAVGSIVAMGEGVVPNDANAGDHEAYPFSGTCNWTSSDTTRATVDRHGLITAVAPGSVTITCGRAGNGVYGQSTAGGWISPGNTLTLNIVNGGTGSTTWYVRPDGGTPFVSSTLTPAGQCDGKHDTPYPGSGVNQPCALGDYEYLYFDQVNHHRQVWMISGGDTVIVRQKPGGYNVAMNTIGYSPTNCIEPTYCDLPSVPSGTAAQHTRILGENFGSCHNDSAKTLLTLNGREAFNTKDSQFLDVACFTVADKAACAADGEFTHSCKLGGDYFGRVGIWQSALTSFVNYTDILIDGLASEGIHGPAGSSTVHADYVHIRGAATAGIDMDDTPWLSGNISVAGGFTMTNSITEFSGCVEEYPVVHNYPYLECRDQSTAPSAPLDGFGTGSTTGTWAFDHDIWRYNFQDGLDLLHSGMQSLTVTNSQSYGNDGQAYKIGPADTVIFRNNYAMVNCNRIGQTIGDEPASAVVAGVTLCRAAGDWVPFNFTNLGSYIVQNNTFAGYGATIFDLACSNGWDFCTGANAVFQNNAVMAYTEPTYDAGQAPGLFYLENGSAAMPALQGWSVRDHNVYYGVRYCPGTLAAGEICNTVDPGFQNEPHSPVNSEAALDNFSFVPASGSPLLGAGTPIAGLTADILGNTRAATPSIGAVDVSGLGTSSIQQPSSTTAITLSATPASASAGANVTLTASASPSGSAYPTGTITFTSGTSTVGTGILSSGVATFTTSSFSPGTYLVTATYGGDANFVAATSNPATVSITSANALQPTLRAALSPNPAVVGQTVTFSALVSGSGSVSPTGNVNFTLSGKTIVAPLTSGAATIQLPSLPAGSYPITATYPGDTNYNPTSASAGTLVISTTASSKAPTTLLVAATPNPATTTQPLTLTATVPVAKGVTPTGSVNFTLNNTTVSAALNSSGIASATMPAITSAGTYTATAAYAGDINFSSSSATTASVTVSAPLSAVSISVAQPDSGFNVIPGSVRRIFARVSNGATNQVTWAVKSGSAQISSSSASWVDVTAGSSGSSCQLSNTGTGISSATQFTLEATSVDDTSKKADITFNVCKPTVQVSVVPTYRTLYASQNADIQSLVVGSSNDAVQWAITSQPSGGDGKLADSSARDTVFSATVPGRYTLSATSVASSGQTATSTLYVTGHSLPYRVTRNQTEPVDCTVDPALLGTTYDVGPSQKYQHLNDLPISTILNGSTIRLHNEDTTGSSPTTYNEYLQLSQHAAPDQPIRVCGVPDIAGNLPIVDATNAVGRSDVTSFAAGNGLVTIGGSTSGAAWPAYNGAQNIVVEGLHLRNANAGLAYVSPSGTKAVWQSSAACVRIGDGHNISLIGNEIDSCATGAASQWNGTTWGGSSLNHLWEGNYIHGSGTAGSSANHQMYLQAWGQVVQFNRIDQIAANTSGANLKSRGIQDVIRYNYFGDGSARDLDLVDVGTAAQWMSFGDFFGNNASPTSATYSMDQLAAWQEAWNSHFAYGNIYLNSTSLAPIHFAYDQSGAEAARKGNLFWYNNTFYQSTCASCSGQLLTMFDTSGGNGSYLAQTEFQTVEAINNLIWMDTVGQPVFQWNDFDAFIGLGASNLLPSGWGANTLQGSIGDGWNATGNAAAYQNAANLALHITGFTGTNTQTTSSIPFEKVSLLLNTADPGTSTMPAQTCEMPTRFTYLPLLGYALPRVTTPNIGATDTIAQVSSSISLIGSGGHLTVPSANCK